MSKRKSNKPVVEQEINAEELAGIMAVIESTAPVAIDLDKPTQLVPVSEWAEQDAALATVQPTTKRTKMQMRGRSQIVSPVAAVWVICNNAFVLAQRDGKAPPTRKELFDLCIEATIAPYTARTQIQLFLKASNRGAHAPVGKLPKGFNISA